MLYVFDSIVKPEYAVGPDGSYERSFAGVTGCTVRRLGNGDDGDDGGVNDTTEKEQGDGLDPLKVLPTKRMAADFLSSIAGIRENEQLLLSQLYRAAELSSSVDQLLQQQAGQGELRTRLEANLQPYMRLFRGESKFTERMVFILDLPTRQVRDAAAFLALSAVWKMIKEQPVRRRKAVVVDEGWALVEKDPATGRPYFPLAVSYVPEIARTGRHFNTCFVIATQMVTDLLGRAGEYGPGRDMIESCSTKVVLKQDQASSALLREAFNLSDAEESFVLNADIGTGMLLTTEGHIPFHVFLSQFEKDIFTTRPDQVE
jgi:type IV secretory pathway VirB4 component